VAAKKGGQAKRGRRTAGRRVLDAEGSSFSETAGGEQKRDLGSQKKEGRKTWGGRKNHFSEVQGEERGVQVWKGLAYQKRLQKIVEGT